MTIYEVRTVIGFVLFFFDIATQKSTAIETPLSATAVGRRKKVQKNEFHPHPASSTINIHYKKTLQKTDSVVGNARRDRLFVVTRDGTIQTTTRASL
jgi:hypothetical protein|tara:strand:+ start:152 stop:442 length:291 start_codon:yes stop_codon:yes gene_type:complete